MNLVNKNVVHGTFGKGKIVSYDNEYIQIDFESGTKKFVFPDVFGDYMTLIDEEAAKKVDKKLEIKQAEDRKKALQIEKEKMLRRERRQQRALENQQNSRSSKANPKLQSVFWCKAENIEEMFNRWEVFVGKIKSGKNKGQPRRLARMNRRSACLLTQREADVAEADRRILGVFMVKEDFNGNPSEEGYISAHSKYRLRLTEEESEKMLFWNYYMNPKFPDRMTWNSGKQRYFDNVWMAQILRDIIALRKDTEGEEEVQVFFDHFCMINGINKQELPEANGALTQQE